MRYYDDDEAPPPPPTHADLMYLHDGGGPEAVYARALTDAADMTVRGTDIIFDANGATVSGTARAALKIDANTNFTLTATLKRCQFLNAADGAGVPVFVKDNLEWPPHGSYPKRRERPAFLQPGATTKEAEVEQPILF